MSALLLLAQAAWSLFHKQYRCDPAKMQTLVLHERDKPLDIVGLQEAFYALGKMIKDESEVQLISDSEYAPGHH